MGWVYSFYEDGECPRCDQSVTLEYQGKFPGNFGGWAHPGKRVSQELLEAVREGAEREAARCERGQQALAELKQAQRHGTFVIIATALPDSTCRCSGPRGYSTHRVPCYVVVRDGVFRGFSDTIPEDVAVVHGLFGPVVAPWVSAGWTNAERVEHEEIMREDARFCAEEADSPASPAVRSEEQEARRRRQLELLFGELPERKPFERKEVAGSPPEDVGIEDLDLSVRSTRALQMRGIATLADLLRRSESDLRAEPPPGAPAIAEVGIREIIRRLSEAGLTLHSED